MGFFIRTLPNATGIGLPIELVLSDVYFDAFCVAVLPLFLPLLNNISSNVLIPQPTNGFSPCDFSPADTT